jgi:hypothetical protein
MRAMATKKRKKAKVGGLGEMVVGLRSEAAHARVRDNT